MSQWYDLLRPHDVDWINMSVRYSPMEGLLPSSIYLNRLYHSLHDFFIPWFQQRSPLPFLEILKQQHLALVIGNDGQEPYQGTTASEHGLNVHFDVAPGQFRHLVPQPHSDPHRISFHLDKLQGMTSGRLGRLIRAYQDDPGTDKMIEPTEMMTLDYPDGPHYSLDVIVLPQVTHHLHIWNQIYATYITHHYPNHEDKDLILQTMSSIMTQLRQYPTLPLLEQYLYLGIHVHVFESVNFSLMMAQFNYVLSRLELHGINHSNLDWIALAEQFPEFQRVLRHQIEKANQGGRSPPSAPLLERGLKRGFAPLEPSRPSHWISILAHLGDGDGDRYFAENELIEHTETSVHKRIEGLNITTSLPSSFTLEYMVHIEDYGDTAWQPARTFVGTWGQSKALEGLAIRLHPKGGEVLIEGTRSSQDHPQRGASPPFHVCYMGRVIDRWTGVCHDGEYCGTRGQRKAITGLIIWITI